ncbi:hypothetical protein HF289_08660 [Acidithiobacillus ferrooxidans]|uniref:hypothetical protein n=1 Tax=Acidithiobacillus ferrooxidans TaxID=920 RepID=UPI001C07DA7A|nr:hypothetical protein [Acidithiobacillus ferrooxidans]MBU2856941.1 hypothetical protein [Acidithiobacillus ferrooxidans]
MSTERFLNGGGYALIAWAAIAQAYIEYRFVWPPVAHWLAPHKFVIYSITGHVLHWN